MAIATTGLDTLVRAFELVNLIADAGPGGTSATRLSQRLNMPRRTVYRYLSTLVNLDLIEQLGQQPSAYRLGHAIDRLAAHSSQQREFLRQSTESVELLAKSIGQLVHCTVYDQGSVVTVATAAANGDSRQLTTAVGNRRPAHTTASGKIFLTHVKSSIDAYVTRELTRRTSHTITSAARLREECQKVLAQGYASDNHEFATGVCCLAVPVWGARHQVVGTLSTSWASEGPIRVDPVVLSALKSAAHNFTQSIGGKTS